MSLDQNVLRGAKVVGEAVDPDSLEATRWMQADQEQTLLFTNLNGGKAAANVYSTRAKVAAALGVPKDGIVQHLMAGMAAPQPVHEVVAPAFRYQQLPLDLMKLPVVKYFPRDGGRYISAGIVVAEYNGKRNVSFHRMMLMDKDRIAIRLVPRHLFTLYNEALRDGRELKIAICIGAPIEAMISAALSVDYGTDELQIASALHQGGHGVPLDGGRCDNGLLVPADCDYVLEARLTADTTKEGPFVDIAGTYDPVRDQPIVKVDKIWAKEGPVFQLLLPGGYEHFLLMGLPREPVIFRTVRQAVPRVRAVRLTEGGCCWLNGVVAIAKNKEGDGVNAIMAAFTGHPSMKNVIVVDDDIDIFNDREVEWAAATRMQGDRIIRIPGAAGSSLDPSMAADRTTWKVGFDATLPLGADRTPFVKANLPEKH
ncbi:MAG: UbiD family decarboxylase [Methanomethylophilus sp.]